MTVQAALALSAVRHGHPEVVVGSGGLERPIRWVASGDVPWIARDLKGGELLLTRGSASAGARPNSGGTSRSWPAAGWPPWRSSSAG